MYRGSQGGGIKAAAGYSQFSDYLSRPVVAQGLLTDYYARTVFREISNTSFFGALRNGGDTVTFYRSPKVPIHEVNKNDTIKHDTLETEHFDLTIDCAQQFSIKVSHIDEKMIQDWPRWARAIRESAATALAQRTDTKLLNYIYTQCHPCNQGNQAGISTKCYDLGQVGNPYLVDANTILPLLTSLQGTLMEQNVPSNDLFVVVPPIFASTLFNSPLSAANLMGLSQSPILSGRLPNRLQGFDIIVSNNLPMVTDPATGKKAFHIVAGSKSATAFASCLDRVRVIKDSHESWDTYYQGLQVYGFGVVRPESLACAYVYFC